MTKIKIFVWDDKTKIAKFEIDNCIALKDELSYLWIDQDALKIHLNINTETFDIQNFHEPSETYCIITVKNLPKEVIT